MEECRVSDGSEATEIYIGLGGGGAPDGPRQSLVLKRIAHIGVNEERDPAQADMMEEERHDADTA